MISLIILLDLYCISLDERKLKVKEVKQPQVCVSKPTRALLFEVWYVDHSSSITWNFLETCHLISILDPPKQNRHLTHGHKLI